MLQCHNPFRKGGLHQSKLHLADYTLKLLRCNTGVAYVVYTQHLQTTSRGVHLLL
jgi:hypothetical protein